MKRPNAFCVGCGCSDNDACLSDQHQQPCQWLYAEYIWEIGLCNYCGYLQTEWEGIKRDIKLMSNDDRNNYIAALVDQRKARQIKRKI